MYRPLQTLVFLWTGLVLGTGSPDSGEIQITRFARSLQPGEVFRLDIESSRPLENLDARALGKTFAGYPSDPAARHWQILIGIDLEAPAGPQEIQLRASYEHGGAVEQSYPIVIQDKSFPTRRLTVDPKYVNPPDDVLERIREESQRNREIFASFSPLRFWSKPFSLPLSGEASSSFGKRSILNGQPRSPHSGTDFSAKTGTPVKAPNAGRIVLADNLYYSGNTVIVDHGLGLYSYFGHLSEMLVEPRQFVRIGEVLGKVGATGRVTGPHLHWAVRLKETRVDPLSLIAVSEEEGLD